MAVLGRFLLELLRIIALLIIISGLLQTVITSVLTSIGSQGTEHLRGVVSFISVVAMVIWYRRRGQYNGWFKVDRER